MRTTYGDVEKLSAGYQFSEHETKEIHNKYMHSHTWMTEAIHKDYQASQKTHSFVKGRFNVYFAKTWGSKAVFMHLVRCGPSSDVAEMLRRVLFFYV